MPEALKWSKPLEGLSVLRLADNVIEAMTRLNELNEIHSALPGLDCGTCGAPSCRALAEDIVRGTASINDCVFRMGENMDESERENFMPAPFRHNTQEE